LVGFLATSVIAFVSTNIDNIFVIMLLYAQTGDKLKKQHVIIGQYIGIGILVAISILGALGLNFIPQKYIGLLGVIPITLGIKSFLDYKKDSNRNANSQEKNAFEPPGKRDFIRSLSQKFKSVIAKIINPQILSVIIVAVANGADNIGVYIPIFTGYSAKQLLVTSIIFTILMALWCFLGYKITSFPKIKNYIQKYQHIAIPIVFIALGIYIILKAV